MGRRIAKQTTVKPSLGRSLGPSLGFTQTFSYLINQDKILLAKSGDGTLSLYLDGQRIDEHLGEVSRNGNQTFFTDHLGSVLNSAIAGTLHSYDAFGRRIAGIPVFPIILSSEPVLYGFAGRQFDLESAKYYNRARMYDPNTGRFLNQDPLGLMGGLNLYRYAGNNPNAFIDPMGLCGVTPLLGVAAAIGLALTFSAGAGVTVGLVGLGLAAGFVARSIGGTTEDIFNAVATAIVVPQFSGVGLGVTLAAEAAAGNATGFSNGSISIDNVFSSIDSLFNPAYGADQEYNFGQFSLGLESDGYSLGNYNYSGDTSTSNSSYNLGDYNLGDSGD